MSENLHNIDDLFRKAVDRNDDTPSHAVWDAIDKELDKKKVVSISKKYNKLKWAAAVLLLVSAGMALYTLQTRMRNKEMVKQNDINRSKKQTNHNEQHSTPLINAEEKKQESQSKQTNHNPVNDNNPKSPQVSENDQNISRSVQVSDDERNNLADRNKTKQQTAIHSEKNTEPPKQDKVFNASDKIKNEKTEDFSKNAVAERKVQPVPLVLRQPSWDMKINGSPLNVFASPSIPVTTIQDNNLDIKERPTARVNNKAIKTQRTSFSAFSLSAFYAPQFVTVSVEDDHPRWREDNRHDIKNSEKTKLSSSYGILLGYSFGKFSVESGLSIFNRESQINNKTVYARPDNHGNINFRISCTSGSAYVPLKSGNTPAQGDSTQVLSAKNSLTYTSVPLNIKYTFGTGKVKVVSSAGIAANFLSKGKIESVLSAQGSNEKTSTENIEGLKSNYFSTRISVGAEYQGSGKTSFFVSPAASFALTSINKDAAVKTRLNSFGIAAGIKIRL